MTSPPISPPPVTGPGPGPDHLPAYVSNGVIGLRVMEIPLRAGLTMLNGLAAIHPVQGIEYSPEAPYPLAGDLAVGRVCLGDRAERARLVEQRYDFTCGELHTHFTAELDGVDVDVEMLTFASRTHPALALQEVSVAVSRACQLTLTAIVSTAGVPGRTLERAVKVSTPDGEVADGTLRFEPPGALSTTGVAIRTELLGDRDARRSYADWYGNGDLATSYEIAARTGRRYRLRQVASMLPSSQHQVAEQQAVRLLTAGTDLGFDELRRRNRAAWDDLWRGRVVLLGADERWQALADAASFYLHSSVHPSSPASTSIFGLAQWRDYHYYYGHVMWDIEAFSVPPLQLTQPDAARAILDFRARTLATARRNARLHGRRGIQFPWEAGPMHGEESAPLGANGPSYEDHLSCVVAMAFARHVHATGDGRFAADTAWPVVSGVADWIVSRAERTSRGFEIRRAMGVAERDSPADNDAFTNLAAAAVLREAHVLARALGAPCPPEWADVADGLVLPIDEHGVLVDHDDFDPTEDKAATPSAPAGILLHGAVLPSEVASATRRYFLDRADEYVGSPMLSSLLGVFAAHEGDRRRSMALFESGYAAFCSSRFANVHEYRPDRFPDEPVAGPFYANLSGFLLACTFGLGHVRFGPGPVTSWCHHGPIVMPSGWDGVEIERVWVRGRPHRFLACHGDATARIEPTE